jgi:two-component system chemotaxis response regulator CheY
MAPRTPILVTRLKEIEMHALIVEDEITSRMILEKVLQAYGTCDLAMNGREAIAAFRSAWEQSSPYDLICLDIKMPKLDGQDTLRHIRRIEKQRDLPAAKVVMTTALDSTEAVADAIFLGGACAYFVKPIESDHFIKELKAMGLIEQ